MNWTISELDAALLPQVAQVQTTTWAVTYATTLPPDYLAGPMARDIAERWSRPLGPQDLVIGAVDTQGTLLGFSALLLEADAIPYLDNFHVLPRCHGTGVAQDLMVGTAQALVARGLFGMRLTVLGNNARARAFYARMGGQEGEEGPDAMFDQPVLSIPVVWSDVNPLAKKRIVGRIRS